MHQIPEFHHGPKTRNQTWTKNQKSNVDQKPEIKHGKNHKSNMDKKPEIKYEPKATNQTWTKNQQSNK